MKGGKDIVAAEAQFLHGQNHRALSRHLTRTRMNPAGFAVIALGDRKELDGKFRHGYSAAHTPAAINNTNRVLSPVIF
jgi:hypothetical protein